MKRLKQIHVYTVDLTKIDGRGDFACPRCGNIISPDDTAEKAYSILEPKVNSKGLEELIIQCNRCGSFIHLTGFSFLQETPRKDQKIAEAAEKEKPRCYISHV